MSKHTYLPGDLVSIVLPETDYYYARLLGHPAPASLTQKGLPSL